MQGLHLFPLTLCPSSAFSSGLYVIVHQEIIAELKWWNMEAPNEVSERDGEGFMGV